MKNEEGGIMLILIGLTALYLYNTGRLSAVVKVLQNPSVGPAAVRVTSSGGTTTATVSSLAGDLFGGNQQIASSGTGSSPGGGISLTDVLNGFAGIGSLFG